MQMKVLGVLLAYAVSLAMIYAPGASAHRSPGTCLNNGGIGITFGSAPGLLLRNGDDYTLTATVPADNTPNRCDITDATVFAQFPNPDGTLSDEEVVIATGQSFQPGVATPVPGSATRKIQFDPGVFVGPVAVGYRGTVHFDPHTGTGVGNGQPNGPRISRPVTEISVQAVPGFGPAPLFATYSYAVTNVSPAVVPQPCWFRRQRSTRTLTARSLPGRGARTSTSSMATRAMIRCSIQGRPGTTPVSGNI